MGFAEFIAVATLATGLGGGLWSLFSELNGHLSGMRSDLAVLKWRLFRLERELGVQSADEVTES